MSLASAKQERRIDPDVLRHALGSFPTGVTVITTNGPDGKPVGLTCNSFNSVSLDPPLVSWGLRLASSNLAAFRQAPSFAVHVLAEHQNELSTRFARRDVPDKFAGVGWRAGLDGVPVLDGCVATFQCRKFAEHLAGDHVLFLGEVVHFEHRREEDSLVFYRGAYMAVAQSLQEVAASCRMDAAGLQQARRLINCMLARLACENATPEDLDAIDANIVRLEHEIAAGNAEARIAVGLEFFRLVARAAHNEVLVAVSESLGAILRQVLKSAGPGFRFRADLVPQRRRILAALRARDAASAEKEMSNYFRETGHLEQGLPAPSAQA